ncbi:hypothetical protein Bca52824_053392 [Brassica carinata]|uniref:Uncharacterized protein n=1 Tax=Brassica carinata TaxID=52824 RepID=A0A8X7R5T4_BRACI|nr:hypothetical protein Bca52824_053392 [Brassica carinata]
MAAQVIVAIENPLDIIVQSARPYGQRAVLKFARYTGANAIAGRHNPGIFINQMQTSFSGPCTGHRPIKEGALGNIRIISFRDTDSPMRFVDIGIHANNKGKQSIVDLLLYRELEEAKPEDEDKVGQTLDYLLLNMVGETNGPLL